MKFKELKQQLLFVFSKSNLFIVLLSLLILLPSIMVFNHSGLFRVDDDIQTMRVLEMTKCFKDFQIPCRWVPDMGYGYGYPQFIYYGPLPYYLMAIGHLFGISIINSVKLYFALVIILSFYAFYYFSRRFVGPLSALFGAFLYTYAPYKLTDIFNRGAVGEFTVWLIIPFVLAFIFDLSEQPKNKKTNFFLIITAASLIITHNLSLVLYTPLIVIWSFYWLVEAKNKREYLVHLVIDAFFSFLLTAWFWLPMLYYQNQVHIETMFSGYFNYLAHFLSLKEILFARFWDWGDSQLGIWDRMTLTMGIWAWLLSLLVLVFSFIKKNKYSQLIFISFLTFFPLLFLCHSRSTFIYQALPFLQKLQFPWRWLSPIVFLTAFLGSFFLEFFKKNLRLFIFFFFVFIISLNYGFWFRFEKWQDWTDKTKFSGFSWRQQQTISIFDYLPKSASHPPTKPSPEKPYFLKGNGKVVFTKRGTNYWLIKTRIESPQAVLEIPNFYYPGWVVKDDGHYLKIDFKNELGLLRLSLTHGQHNLKVKMKRTLIFWLADLSSFLGLVIFLYYSFDKERKRLK